MSETALYLDTPEFRRQADKFVKLTGQDMKPLIYDIMAQMVQNLYAWTAPPTKGNRGSRGGRAGGKALVQDDIYKAAEGREQGYLDLLYRIYGGEINNAEWNKKGTGTKYTLRNVQISPSGDGVQDFHFGKRTRSGGVPGRGQRDGSNVSNKILMPYNKLNKYIRDTQRRVGKLKAGWVEALQQLNAKMPPGWVKTAGRMQGKYGTASGSFSDKSNLADMTGDLTAINNTPYARDNDGMQRRAAKVAQTYMQKHGDRWLERMVQKHGQVK